MPALPLLFFVAALVIVAVLKARRAVAVVRWVAATPDRTMRRLLGASLVPGLAVAIALIASGLPPPPAFAAAAIVTLGVLVAAAGVLGVEGALVEPGSVAEARVARGDPPPSTPAGRAIAIAIGAALTAGASALCWYVAHI